MKTNQMRVVAASVLLFGAAARGQSETFRQGLSIWVFNWEIAGPVGDFKHYVSDWSLRGFSLEGRFLAIDGLSVGLSASFNRWQQTYSQLSVPVTVAGATGIATGPVFRYNDMFALRALAHKYFGPVQGMIQPYVGVGIGGVWSYSYQQIADLTNVQDSFNFIVDPEVGALITLLRRITSLAVNFAFRYTFTTASPGRTSNASTIGPIIGLAWYY